MIDNSAPNPPTYSNLASLELVDSFFKEENYNKLCCLISFLVQNNMCEPMIWNRINHEFNQRPHLQIIRVASIFTPISLSLEEIALHHKLLSILEPPDRAISIMMQHFPDTYSIDDLRREFIAVTQKNALELSLSKSANLSNASKI